MLSKGRPVILVASFLACSSSGSKFDSTNGPDAGEQPIDQDSSAPIKGDSGPQAPAISCSADLHSVLDQSGDVVTTCGSDQGCGPNGTCVPACESARVNKSTLGCDYFDYSPEIVKAGRGACFATFVANTWTTPISLSVDRGGQQLDVTKFARIPSGTGKKLTYAPLSGGKLQAGEVAILFLSHSADPDAPINDVPCPIPAAVEGTDAAVHGTGMGQAFHVTASAPVVAYDIFPYGGGAAAATSATLLLPVSAWDTNYLAVHAYASNPQNIAAGAQPFIGIVAAENGTQVTISPTSSIAGGPGVVGTNKGVPHTYNLGRGQLLQFTQDDELTGSPIQSNKPVALFGGAASINVEPTVCCADSAHQQIPPISALGSEYTVVKYRNRDEAIDEDVPYRVMGTVDGTQLTYFPSAPLNAPTTLKGGQLVTFTATQPFVVKSQDGKHPFYVSAHMTGCMTYFSPQDCRGDAEFVNVVPSKQFLSSYTFFTDPTYPETNLVVTRAKRGEVFRDVTLDCFGTLTGWKSLGEYEYTRVDLQRHNFQKQGNCDNGRHEMHSPAPFGVTVWGWGSAETGGAWHIPQAPGFYSQAVSYAYPVGMSVKPINDVVVAPVPR